MVYDISKEKYTTWRSANPACDNIVITGKVSVHDFCTRIEGLNALDYRSISFDEFEITPIVDNDGRARNLQLTIYGELYCDDYTKLEPIYKIVLNDYVGQSFIVEDGIVYNEDRTALIHAPEEESYIIPTSIHVIGDYAFCHYTRLSDITFPKALTKIGDYAFYGCDGLETVDLPLGLNKIGKGAFYMCNLESIIIPEGVDEIPFECFSLNQIENADIPGTVKNIDDDAFHCNYIYCIKIEEGTKRIGSNAFSQWLHRISLPSTLTEIATDFYYEAGIGDKTYPPYIDVSERNRVFYSKNGTLFFRNTDECAISSKYNGIDPRFE